MPAGFGLSKSHNAHIYSDAKATLTDTKTEPYSDSWDNQGIYLKKDFELTALETTPQKEHSPV